MKRYIIISLLMFCGLAAMAQGITVKGNVVDELGEPVMSPRLRWAAALRLVRFMCRPGC